MDRWKAIFGFVGDSTLSEDVADVSPDGDVATQVYCPLSVDRKSVGKINISCYSQVNSSCEKFQALEKEGEK